MNRLAGIILAAAGFVIAVLSVVKVLPGLTGPGVVMILTGGLVIGLSFITPPDPDDVERMSTGSTLGNIFFAPGEVFRNLRRHPRWLVALLIVSALSAVYYNLFLYRLTPERVVNYSIDKTLEMSMIQNNDEAKKRVEESRPKTLEEAKNPLLRAGQAIAGFGGSMFVNALVALIFFLFVLAMGGRINFLQAFSVAVYAYFPVGVIRMVLNTILLFIKDPADIHPIMGQSTLIQDNLNFLVAPADHPALFALLGTLSLLWFYWVWLNAVGLREGGESVSSSAAWTASLGLYGILIGLALVSGLLFGSFMS
jgi:hypothetical protein